MKRPKTGITGRSREFAIDRRSRISVTAEQRSPSAAALVSGAACGKTISHAKDSTRKHWLVRHSQDDKELGWIQGDPVIDKDGNQIRGTGVGSDVEIQVITPDLARLVNTNPPIAVKSNWTEGNERHTLAFADEILVHELVHAMRDMAGLSTCRRVPRQPRYGTMEEFFAIVVANIYRSECGGRPGVRNSSHGKWEVMYCSGKHFLQLTNWCSLGPC